MEVNQIRFPFYLVSSHGTVIVPLLFSLYINDITDDIDSELRLFADDCVGTVKSKILKHSETSGGYSPFRMLGKELGHEVPTSQMQYLHDRTGNKWSC